MTTLERLSEIRKQKQSILWLLDEERGIKDPETRRILENELFKLNYEIREMLRHE